MTWPPSSSLVRGIVRYGQESASSRASKLAASAFSVPCARELLSLHRVVQVEKQEHKGKIITMVPNDMWGTDGTKIFAIDDGWCWLFTVEHWNAECVGWHIAKTGDRFAALQPLSMAIINDSVQLVLALLGA